MRRCASFVLLIAMSLAVPSVAGASPCWLPPVVGTIDDPFRAPPCPYCAGNRGIEFSVARPTSVRSVAAGEVTWAGTIAGTRYVVVQLANGWRVTYGRLDSSPLVMGDRVLSRMLIGSASGAFYFGVRRGDDYIDPAPYLGSLRGRPRLVPLDGTPARPTPPPRVRCTPA